MVVTGAAAGIGRATAVRVAREGARAAMLDIAEGPDVVEAITRSGGQARYWQADVSDEAAVAAAAGEMVAWLGGVDALLHVAGIMRGQQVPVGDVPVGLFDEVIGVNLRGSFLMVKHLAPALEAAGGAVVLTSSQGGVCEGSGSVAYGASKGGIHGLALTLERALEPRGVRVTEVAPGSVDTELFRRSVQEGLTRNPDIRLLEAAQGTAAPPEAVAAVMAFLASQDGAAVRGLVRTC